MRATRALFDERGLQDAPIEEIARAVGIARGPDLPPVLLQGGALRPHRDRLPGRARRAAGRGDVGRPRAGRAARGVGARLRRLLPALPRVPGLRAVAHAPAGRRAARGAVGLGVAAPGPGDRQLRGPRVGDPARRRPGRHVHRRGPRLHGQRAVDAGPRRHPPGPHPRRRAAGSRRASRSSSRWRPSASWTRAWPACWRPSAPSRQARARGAATAFGRRHALRGAPAGGRVAARADGGRRRRALRRQVPRRGAGAGRARGRGRGRRAGAAAGAAGPRARDPRAARRAGAGRARPRDPGPALRQRGHQPGRRLPARARCRSRRPPWPRSIPSWRPTSCGSTR